MSNLMDFSFDDGKVIQAQGIEKFKQEKSNQQNKVSIVAFKSHAETVFAAKAKERGEPLSDEEKAELNSKVDVKLAENLGKKVDDLTEIDRLNLKSPRFSVAWTHYGEGIGTIRCLSERDKSGQVVKPALCCKATSRLKEAEQKIATLVMVYPTDEEGKIEHDIFMQRKFTRFEIWRLTPKKFRAIQSCYTDARENNVEIVDLRVVLDKDPKYQNQVISNPVGAAWAKDDVDPEVRNWVLGTALKNYKYVKNELGFEMSVEKLSEKLSGMQASSSALSEGSASASSPRVQNSYKNLLD